jgi:hypothetical protein
VENGSLVRAIGVCSIQEATTTSTSTDPASIQLRARTPRDLIVVKWPPWWQQKRLLWIMGVTLVIALVALCWVIILHRKNILLRKAQAELRKAHDELQEINNSASKARRFSAKIWILPRKPKRCLKLTKR